MKNGFGAVEIYEYKVYANAVRVEAMLHSINIRFITNFHEQSKASPYNSIAKLLRQIYYHLRLGNLKIIHRSCSQTVSTALCSIFYKAAP